MNVMTNVHYYPESILFQRLKSRLIQAGAQETDAEATTRALLHASRIGVDRCTAVITRRYRVPCTTHNMYKPVSCTQPLCGVFWITLKIPYFSTQCNLYTLWERRGTFSEYRVPHHPQYPLTTPIISISFFIFKGAWTHREKTCRTAQHEQQHTYLLLQAPSQNSER